MNNQQLIHEFHTQLVEVYNSENLKCLRGNQTYKIKDKEFLLWHTEVVNKNKPEYKNQFNYFNNIDDLLICSDEIMHFAGLLYLYRPFINNPLNEVFIATKQLIYPNEQNLEAKRYYMYADTTSEKIYNYWNKIGNLIASFFPHLHSKNNIYFSTAIKNVPRKYASIPSFKWLRIFYEDEYLKLNSNRIQVVHHNKTDTTDRYEHVFNATNRQEMEKWVKKRYDLADYYKKHLELTLEGFYQTLCFLEEIGNSYKQ